MKKTLLYTTTALLLLAVVSLQTSYAAEKDDNRREPTPVVPTQSQQYEPPVVVATTPTPTAVPGAGSSRPVTPTPTPRVQATPTPTPIPASHGQGQNNSDTGQGSQNQPSNDTGDSQQGVLSLTVEEVPSNSFAVPYVPTSEPIVVNTQPNAEEQVSTTEKEKDQAIRMPLKGLFLFAQSQDYYQSQKLSTTQTTMLLAIALFFILNGFFLIKPKLIWKHFMTIKALKKRDDHPIRFFGDESAFQGVKGGKSEHVIFYPLNDL